MKRLVLVLNGKGGVGKSFFAVNFVQFLKYQSIAHVAIDSDNENSTLKRFHPDAQFLDRSQRREAALRRIRFGPRTPSPGEMKRPDENEVSFDDDFEADLVQWREKHRLREDDAVLLLVDLFRIHQH